MSCVDYLQFRQSYRNSLMHSPKGTTWKNHKYIKKIDGRYIYEKAKIETSYQLEHLGNQITDRYWDLLGKAIDKVQSKRVGYEMSRLRDKGYDPDYVYDRETDTIGERNKEPHNNSTKYTWSKDLSLSDFVIIDGQIYKKTGKRYDKFY